MKFNEIEIRDNFLVITDLVKKDLALWVVMRSISSRRAAQKIMRIINARPEFVEAPTVEFEVMVTRDENNTLIEPRFFNYTSPLLKDDENMALSIMFTGFEDLEFVSFPQQDMN